MEQSRIALSTIVGRTSDVSFARVHDEMLALDEQAGYYYVMNETSSRIWELIAEPVPVSAVCDRLCEEFVVDHATCQREVLQFLQALLEAGLLRLAK